MSYQDLYKQKLTTAEEAVKVVKSGDWVDYTTNLGFPVLLDAALAKRRDELTDVKIRGNLCFGPIQVVECDPTREHFIYNTWHCSAYERKLTDKGLCNYIPMIFRNVIPYYRHFLTVNVAMMSVTPMDKHGYFNISCAAGIGKGILEQADIVILEVNERLPRIFGGFDECVHISDVDYIVEGEHGPLPEFPVSIPTEEDIQIADHIIPYIVDGSTLQLGVEIGLRQIGKTLQTLLFHGDGKQPLGVAPGDVLHGLQPSLVHRHGDAVTHPAPAGGAVEHALPQVKAGISGGFRTAHGAAVQQRLIPRQTHDLEFKGGFNEGVWLVQLLQRVETV